MQCTSFINNLNLYPTLERYTFREWAWYWLITELATSTSYSHTRTHNSKIQIEFNKLLTAGQFDCRVCIVWQSGALNGPLITSIAPTNPISNTSCHKRLRPIIDFGGGANFVACTVAHCSLFSPLPSRPAHHPLRQASMSPIWDVDCNGPRGSGRRVLSYTHVKEKGRENEIVCKSLLSCETSKWALKLFIGRATSVIRAWRGLKGQEDKDEWSILSYFASPTAPAPPNSLWSWSKENSCRRLKENSFRSLWSAWGNWHRSLVYLVPRLLDPEVVFLLAPVPQAVAGHGCHQYAAGHSSQDQAGEKSPWHWNESMTFW